MDGKILDENPKQMEVDNIWLQKQIKDQGYKNPKEMLLGLCDDNKTLTLFRNIV